MQGDLALLDAWATGDDASGRELYRRYAQRVVRFFSRKLSDADDPADLVQRTFLKILEARRKGLSFERFDAALFTIARNELFDTYGRNRREGERFDPAVLSLQDLRTGPATRASRLERHQLLATALASLPIDDQLALELYYWEELPMEEVAKVLGITKSAAINRIHRARGILRERLAQLEAAPKIIEESLSQLELGRSPPSEPS